jgi:hypothetical protein
LNLNKFFSNFQVLFSCTIFVIIVSSGIGIIDRVSYMVLLSFVSICGLYQFITFVFKTLIIVITSKIIYRFIVTTRTRFYYRAGIHAGSTACLTSANLSLPVSAFALTAPFVFGSGRGSDWTLYEIFIKKCAAIHSRAQD